MSKKGENIYKRKDGRWEARYIESHGTDGRARFGYRYGKTYREARERANEAKISRNESEAPMSGKENKKLSQFCDEWLRLKRSKIKDLTYVKYSTVIENHIKPKLGDRRVFGLTTLAVEQFSYDLMHVEGLSSKTVRDILTVLHSILTYVKKQLPDLPLVEVIYPKAEKKEMRVLSREEQGRLTEYLLTETDNYKFGTLFSLLTGLRIGEVCALRWRDVSLEEGAVFVRGTMQRVKNFDAEEGSKTRITVSDPKSFSSMRVIPLSSVALELCRKFYGEEDAFILTGDENRYVEPRVLQNRIKTYAEACGLSGVHFHTLRHSFATRCVEVGFEIKSLSEVLGHASPQITLERYVHSSMELKRENMMKLATIGY